MVSVRVDLISSYPHYLSHLQPIWDALPDEIKGDIRTGPEAGHTPKRNHVCLVGSWRDMNPLRGLTKFIYVEHGAGQSYLGGDGKSAHWPDYSGPGIIRHMDVLGYICPNERVARNWGVAHTSVVGCARLDQWLPKPPAPTPKTVMFSFHWPCKVAPESDTAYFHYAAHLSHVVANFKDQGWDSFYQVHPKWEGQIDGQLEAAGMTRLCGDEALLVPEVMICDNSSIAYEAAALGRVGLTLNCPGYRRDVHHGLRFWDSPPGLMVDDPSQLYGLKLKDLSLAYDLQTTADIAANAAYTYRDGKSAERAVNAILSWLP